MALDTIVYTGGLESFRGFEQAGFNHIPGIKPLRSDLRKDAKSGAATGGLCLRCKLPEISFSYPNN
jgi:hypothetical protein